ncbi:MAG: 3-deoxy-manno-octulosonate cytidylyltransferase [Oscillospiraceae bacterium]
MKVVAVIPARYSSTRFPGKPLADICGKPMIWWVYNQVRKVKEIDEVYVATDDERIADVCRKNDIGFLMTADNHPEHISRVHEVSEKIQADYYMCINGDEPLVSPDCIRKVIPKDDTVFFGGAARILTDPAETIDFANLKVVMTETGRCIYISRTPVPYPRGTLLFNYYKYVGIECFSKQALDFFVSTPQGKIEKAEDIDHIRFLEHGKELYFTLVDSDSISVDTPKDLEKVRVMMAEKIAAGEISNE